MERVGLCERDTAAGQQRATGRHRQQHHESGLGHERYREIVGHEVVVDGVAGEGEVQAVDRRRIDRREIRGGLAYAESWARTRSSGWLGIVMLAVGCVILSRQVPLLSMSEYVAANLIWCGRRAVHSSHGRASGRHVADTLPLAQ